MSQVAIVISIPAYASTDAGSFIDVANELVRLVKAQFPIDDNIKLVQIAKSDSAIVVS